MPPTLVYQIALTLVPNIGAVHARNLLSQFGEPASIFRAKKSALERTEGIGSIRAASIKSFSNYKRAEDEVRFIEKYAIRPLFMTDDQYPKRFLNCYDPPILLYFKGSADLNHAKILAIVGTRTNSEYGKHFTENLVRDLEAQDILIISGLAFGIDAIAHKAALKHNLSTIGVVGHGLDTIYPSLHKSLAKEMIANGGILTEFMSGTKPDKHNFPIRNRIVAALCDATVVIETSLKGGSMITAEMANGYNRDVFAVPGKTTDARSAGCNYLIKSNKAILVTDAAQVLETMSWEPAKKKSPRMQRTLFITLSGDEQKILDLFRERELVPIDHIHTTTDLSSSAIAAAILSMEFQGLIMALPGKVFKLL